jgi:hypothetical protein
LVVKNGSNIRWLVVSSIPKPLSATARRAYRPGGASNPDKGWRWSQSTIAVWIRKRPPPGIASLAFYGQIHDHLFQLVRVGEHINVPGTELKNQVNIIPHERIQHRPHPPHDLIKIEDAGLKKLLATKGQEPLSQPGSTFTSFQDPREPDFRGLWASNLPSANPACPLITVSR